MRLFFIILILLATIVAFLRSDLAYDLFHGNEVSMSNWFNRISEVSEKRVMEDFRKEAEPIFAGLASHQIEYAELIMKDRETLGVFYLRYCKGEDINPFIYGNTRTEFCDQIARAGILRNV